MNYQSSEATLSAWEQLDEANSKLDEARVAVSEALKAVNRSVAADMGLHAGDLILVHDTPYFFVDVKVLYRRDTSPWLIVHKVKNNGDPYKETSTIYSYQTVRKINPEAEPTLDDIAEQSGNLGRP